MEYVDHKNNILKEAAQILKCNEKELLNKLNHQVLEMKEKEKEIEALKLKLASGAEDEILDNIKEIKRCQSSISCSKGYRWECPKRFRR